MCPLLSIFNVALEYTCRILNDSSAGLLSLHLLLNVFFTIPHLSCTWFCNCLHQAFSLALYIEFCLSLANFMAFQFGSTFMFSIESLLNAKFPGDFSVLALTLALKIYATDCNIAPISLCHCPAVACLNVQLNSSRISIK